MSCKRVDDRRKGQSMLFISSQVKVGAPFTAAEATSSTPPPNTEPFPLLASARVERATEELGGEKTHVNEIDPRRACISRRWPVKMAPSCPDMGSVSWPRCHRHPSLGHTHIICMSGDHYFFDPRVGKAAS